MKDSFIFEGKKYISSRRASEISDYSSDYIGQLCRAEKLDCRMIGRSWFVTEESLHLHKAQVLHNEIGRDRIQNLKGGKNPSDSSAGKVYEEQAPDMGGSDSGFDSHSDDAKKIPGMIVPPVTVQIKYETDDRPLMPMFEHPAPISISRDDSHMAQKEIVPEKDIDVRTDRVVSSYNTSLVVPFFQNARAMSAIFIMVFVFGAVMIFESGIIRAPDSIGSNDANVISTIRTSFSSLAEFVNDRLFNKTSSPLVVNDSYSDATGLADENWNGIAVVPSTSSSQDDYLLEQKIRNSFSDEVAIKPDSQGTAGVITPVFQTATGEDFVYVLVPVKEDKEDNQSYE